MSDDQHPHLRPVAVAPPTLDRWKDTARRIGQRGIGLHLELTSFETDPTWWMLSRAVKAAGFTADATDGDNRAMALALQTEMTCALDSGSA